MANSAVKPGQVITAYKLNDITTGSDPPASSGYYPVGTIWGHPSGPRVFTSFTAYYSLKNLIAPAPRAEFVSYTSLNYVSGSDYLWTAASVLSGIGPNNWAGGRIRYKVAATTTYYRDRFEVRAGYVTAPLLAQTAYTPTYMSVPARYYWIEWMIGPVFSTSSGGRRVGWCKMLMADDNMSAGSSFTGSQYVMLSTQTSSFTDLFFLLPPATLVGDYAIVTYWVS